MDYRAQIVSLLNRKSRPKSEATKELVREVWNARRVIISVMEVECMEANCPDLRPTSF